MTTGNTAPQPAETTRDDSRREAVARIVAAFAQRPDSSADDIVALSRRLLQIFGPANPPAARETAPPPHAPQEAELPAQPTTPRATPALPMDQAVTDDKVYCLCCGRGFTMLKRHLKAEHGLTEDEYRARFDLPADMPLVAPNYSERKAAYAKRVGLGRYQRDTGES